ncbi:MAG: hypothetical protein RJB32_363 [Actinomycetota bacterium]
MSQDMLPPERKLVKQITLDAFLIALEVLGVVAFALSGVIEAARKHFDLVGVVMVGFITAFGGGTLRDILLDRRPFFWVEQEFWVWVLIALAFFLPFFFRARHFVFTEKAIVIPDAIGLGIFTAGGTHIALELGSSPLIAVLMGVITAVVGGILRDVLVNEVPRAFHDHQPYAVVAFAGGWLVVLLDALLLPVSITLLFGSVFIILLRLMSVKFAWELKRWRFL